MIILINFLYSMNTLLINFFILTKVPYLKHFAIFDVITIPSVRVYNKEK